MDKIHIKMKNGKWKIEARGPVHLHNSNSSTNKNVRCDKVAQELWLLSDNHFIIMVANCCIIKLHAVWRFLTDDAETQLSRREEIHNNNT